MTAAGSGAVDLFDLTAEQQEVVDSPESALVVTAPAGTGKTEVLVRRAEHFVSDPANEYARVLIVTYTTRAAEQFTSRLRRRSGSAMDRVTADTVHGFAQSLLSVHGSHAGLPLDFAVIAKDEDRAELLAEYEPSWQPDEGLDLFRELDLARARGTAHPRLAAWRNALAFRGAVDFNEMIDKATEVLRISAVVEMLRNVYGLVLVDEAQNLTQQQYELLVALIGRDPESGAPRIPTTLLGDPNQLVTGFAGGDSGHIQSFKTDFGAKQLTLSENFRSSRYLSRLEEVLSSELGRNGRHRENEIGEVVTGVLETREFQNEATEGNSVAEWAHKLLTKGLPPEAVRSHESREVLPEEIAVLARHAAALSTVTEALTERGSEVARAHGADSYLSSPVGNIAFLLMRFRSDRHGVEAAGELRREFGIDVQTELMGDSAAVHTATQAALRCSEVPGAEALAPLLSVETPAQFMEALSDCRLAQSERGEVLASWTADRTLLERAWTEFANVTPMRDRSWTRFALHIDRMTQGRDLGKGVRVLTVHKAQGREFKAVAILAMNDGQFPDFRAASPDAKRAELQTFYVAATRASRVLLLTRAASRPTRYGDRSTEPSPYLQFVTKACANR